MFQFIIILILLFALGLMIRVVIETRNPHTPTGPTWEEIEKQHRKQKRGQARAAEQSRRQQTINQAKWDREIEEIQQRAIRRQTEEIGWTGDGWVWDRRQK